VQVDPIKAPGAKRSKPKYGEPHSISGFEFNLRRHIWVNSTDIPTGKLGNKWAQEKFVKWVVGEDEDWKRYWTYANVQKSFDQAIMSLTLADADANMSLPLVGLRRLLSVFASTE